MDFTLGHFKDELIDIANSKRIPVTGQFELTPRCNLRCKMCYICQPANNTEVIKRERSAKEWIHLAEQAREEGLLYILLTGGEVFLRKDFRTIYEELNKMGFLIKIYTNATLITHEIAHWLGRIPPSRMEVTVYGASPRTYAAVCGFTEGYEHTLRGIDLLLAEGIRLKLRTTVIHDNLNDVAKIMDYAGKKELETGIVSYISPRREGRTTDPKEVRLTPEELAALEIELRSISNDNTYRKEYFSEIITNTLNNSVNFSSDTKDSFSCEAGKSSFWVTWDGRMVPCYGMNEPSTMPFATNFHEAWIELQSFCQSVPVCKECMECPGRDTCLSCPARRKSETGYYDRPSPYLCDLVKRRKEIINNILMEL